MRIDIKQLEFIHPRLRKILLDAEHSSGVEFTITSIYRMDDDGVHGTLPVRGVDVRMRSQIMGQVIEKACNSKYRYDPERPHKKCCILHGKEFNMHLHFQVHDRTHLR